MMVRWPLGIDRYRHRSLEFLRSVTYKWMMHHHVGSSNDDREHLTRHLSRWTKFWSDWIDQFWPKSLDNFLHIVRNKRDPMYHRYWWLALSLWTKSLDFVDNQSFGSKSKRSEWWSNVAIDQQNFDIVWWLEAFFWSQVETSIWLKDLDERNVEKNWHLFFGFRSNKWGEIRKIWIS